MVNAHAVALRLAAYEFGHLRHWRTVEVGEVHRDLRQTFHQNTHTLYEMETAGRVAHAAGNLLGDADVGSVEEDVIGDQGLAGADHSRAGRTHSFGSQIGLVVGVGGDGLFDALKLAVTNVFQVNTVFSDGGILVIINRDVERIRDTLAKPARHLDALLHGYAGDWHKRHNIGRSHARVFALMMVEVDQLRRPGNAEVGGFFNRLGCADKRQNGAVMVNIRVPVEHTDAVYACDSSNDRIYHFRSAGF